MIDEHDGTIRKQDATGAGQTNVPGSSRRRFLQKTSTTAVITTLAAQPVWGQCTVSGAMSGGSRPDDTDDPCEFPSGLVGRSPGFWSRGMYTLGNALLSAFPSLTGPDKKDRLTCFIDREVKTQVFTIPSIPSWNGTVANALSSEGGVAWNLAAIYLDAYFGVFSGPIPDMGILSPTHQDWVNHFDGLVYQWGEDTVFNSVFPFGDDDGPTTTWNALGTSQCTV